MSQRTVYVVSRRSVRQDDGSVQLCAEPNRASGLSWVPLHLFADRAAAERCRGDLDRAARLSLCPFALDQDVRHLTSLEEEQFQDKLLELGLMPPVDEWYVNADWVAWWNEVAPRLTEEQVHGVWDLLDRARLYQVVALELDG